VLFTPDVSSPTRWTRHESVFLLVLTMTLVLAVSTFFAPFAAAAALAGLLLSLVLHRSALIDDALPGLAADRDRMPIINIAAIHIGADAGGLMFVGGSIVILALGLPILRWFLIASMLAAAALAAIRVGWGRN
jgi:hypothetical protein